MRKLKYIGPAAIREASVGAPEGIAIRSREELLSFLADHRDEEGGWRTYVVSLGGELLLAPRRSEHVSCSGGRDVLAAGEIRVNARGTVAEVTNNSTGYCPPEDCWEAVRAALDAAAIHHPGSFTFIAHFRRCPGCGERNLVKDDWFVCALCDLALPADWNFDAP